ncbi:MAG: hypothetical protein IPK81_18300 [Rhodospirillales bacterium]|nr:MAG: hypothetical protein IPK81_18300 [Rhodospirillales bacterium]
MPPELDAFLYAPIGEDGNGMALSVLSGLCRLDIDPWDEAERLARLPKDRAIAALGRRLALLPPAVRGLSDAAGIAARLVDLLPRRDFVASVQPKAVVAILKPSPATLLLLVAAVIAVVLILGIAGRAESASGGAAGVVAAMRPAP